ncbi:MAG TPA: DUF1697 domain-containing protein [Flavobacterium sp.]|jgi:uncharacterized protein (DUF1697 family)
MYRQLALLRGINVSGQKIIKMEDLRKLLLDSDFLDVKTYIQSGNVIFTSKQNSKAENALRIKTVISDYYGFDVGVIVIDEIDLWEIIKSNPFTQVDEFDKKQLYVVYLSSCPTTDDVSRVDLSQFYPDEVEIIGKAAYIKFSDSASNSKLTNSFFERQLGVTATMRNLNTTLKLYEMITNNIVC